MQRFESPVLTAVAYPPLILFAPPKAAGGSLVVNVVLFLFTAVFTDWPPVIWLASAAIVHCVLIWLNSKDPHYVSVGEARMQRGRKAAARLSARTRNLVAAEGRKYVP